MKTFVDNISRQVVERHITRPLALIFSAEMIAGLSDEELIRVAGETNDRSLKRSQLQTLQINLELGIAELGRTTCM